MILRPGIQALLEDARRGMFEILIGGAPSGLAKLPNSL